MDNIEAEVNEPPADHGDPQLCIVSSDPGMEGFRITREQLSSLRLKYQQNADGAESFETFKQRARPGGFGSDSYLILPWCGMLLGFERDGYTPLLV